MPKVVLVVDDEPNIAFLVKKVLMRQGYEVVLAFDAFEALAANAQHCFDLYLLDIAMPGMNGFELCKALKSTDSGAGVPVMMLTARGDERARRSALEAGVSRFVTKPFSPKALQQQIAEILEGASIKET